MEENLKGKLSNVYSLKGSLSLITFIPWTKIGEKDIFVSTTSSSQLLQTTLTLDDIWDDSEIIYIRIRDKAGKRGGYFLGTDTFFINYKSANGDTSELIEAGRLTYTYNGTYTETTGTSYGVYPSSIQVDGAVQIRSRYNTGYSRRINGTYKIEVYKLKYPDQVSPFDI